jgi:type I restriction enzyme S subunit
MIEGLQPYANRSGTQPTVRTSAMNIPWLDQIPANWRIIRAKGLFTARTERARPDDEQLSATQAYGVIPQKEFERRVGRKVVQITQHLDKRAHVEPDDFVISMRSFQGGLERAWARGCIRSSYVVLKPSREAQVGYFAHLFKSLDYIRALQATGNFIRDGQDLNFNNFSLVDLPLPPFDEQVAIARFLDHANRKIDGFIRAKRKLIGLLNEQKQAIIHRAVTRGLNPNAPLKPSGIPWLGDIPQHWHRIRLKFEASHIIDCLHATPTYRADGVHPAIRTADIEPGKVRLLQARRILPSEFQKWTERLKPDEGDILYSREGERYGIAANVPPDVELCISQRMMVFRIRKRQNSRFVMWQLNCRHVFLQASLYAIGSTAPHVNVDQIKNFQLAFPPLEEQNAIVEHIDTECAIIDTAIARTEREISLMQEYRTRLTADVVTGKLDVRPAAASLPDLPGDVDTVDPLPEEEMEDTET